MKIYDELVWRGLIQEISSPDLIEKLNNGGMTFYIGTDPTADSMHIGHYSSFLISRRLKQAGHTPLLLVGGATGMIGDPKPDTERPMITKEEVEKNVQGLKSQAEKIFGFEVVNNYDWTKDINVIDFLRDYGKYFNVNYMIAKDKVKSRMETGITYAEFSYMILQALDFLELFETRNCELQVAGSDQWGNITSGIELIRKKTGKEAYGMVMPLVTDSTGKKFGKTEGNALWLDKNKTSSYEMYQYLVNLEDSMIIKYLKMLTFLSKEEIEELEKINNEKPELRVAHKALAKAIITDLHGASEYEKAEKISTLLFGGEVHGLSADDIISNLKTIPTVKIKENTKIIDLLVDNNICSSKREAREMLSSNAISLNNEKVTDENLEVTKEIAIDSKIVLIRKGKKKYFLGIID
ncbi:MAG: tyrosine--tRNA ligase [Candidatus Faecisoma sp.]|jgi:tyrosyl-tRNA synthetase|nr:tyrosine--tRNA ligase [Acholeplasma sp.]MCI5677869.1 tyrosine--tRNA ligase [Acholeplasma sp.]MDY2892927.1 tyrosine--tRNA ligase [Candidatus Faecisoma sp.]